MASAVTGRRFPLPLAVGLGAFLLYAATACPTVFFGDSGELILAAHSLGAAHPPGYPLYTLLGWLALAAPLGEAAWRVNLLSALFAAGACGLVAWLVQRWTVCRAAAAAAGLSLAVSASFWSVATVAEVYALHLLLVTALLACADSLGRATSSRGRSGALIAAGLVLGLGLSHRPTLLLVLPAAVLLAWSPGDRERRSVASRIPVAAWIAAMLLAVLVPLAFYGWMMLRARSGPVVHWGDPTTVSALWAHVTTRRFDVFVLGPRGWGRAEVWAGLWRQFGAGTGWIGGAMALAGLVSAWVGTRVQPLRRVAWALLALALPTLLFGLSYGTEDVEVLFLPLCLVIAMAAGVGVAAAARMDGVAARLAVPLLAVALVAIPALMHFRSHDLRRFTAAADYGRDVLETVPRGGVLFVEGDHTFILAYLVGVLGERRDVTIYDRLGQMFADQLREPGAGPLPGEGVVSFRVRRERAFLVSELSRPAPRAVSFMTWPGYDLPASLRFEPVGLLYAVRRAEDPPLQPGPLWARYREGSVEAQTVRAGEGYGLTVAAGYPLMRGERAIFERDPGEAARQFDRASAIAGESETIHNYLGTIFGRMGDYGRAIRELELAVRAKPVSTRAWNNLGFARQMGGDAAGAREAWRRSLRLDPEQPEIRSLLRRAS